MMESETIRELRRRMMPDAVGSTVRTPAATRGRSTVGIPNRAQAPAATYAATMPAATRKTMAPVSSPRAPAPDWVWQETRTPVRQATREADVIVPALQSAITGFLGGVLIAVAAAGLAVREGWPWYVVPAAWSLGTAVVTAVQWQRLLRETRDLLVRVEMRERPGQHGGDTGCNTHGGMAPVSSPSAPSAPPSDTLRVEYIEPSATGQHWTIDELPVSREVLARIARRVGSGAASWSRRGVASTPGVGEELARQVMAELEHYGYLHYPHGRNHPGGATPTAKGRALFRVLARGSPTPPR